MNFDHEPTELELKRLARQKRFATSDENLTPLKDKYAPKKTGVRNKMRGIFDPEPVNVP